MPRREDSCVLIQVSGWYTLVIFTASMEEYADPVIDWLDAGRGILARRFFRDVRIHNPSNLLYADLLHPVLYAASQRIIYQGLVDHRARSFSSLSD